MTLNKVKRLNYPLIIGGLIVLGILIIVFKGEELTKIDPYAINLGKVEYMYGEIINEKPPIPPNEVNLLGTDILGRDLYSQIIYGARLTLTVGLFVTIFRFLIALPFAFLAGFGERVSSKLIDFFSVSFSAIPALIVSMMVLNFNVIKNMELKQSLVAFTIVLTFVGWGRLAKVLRDRVKDILNEKFIRGQIAIGKSSLMIALQNVLPHMTATIIIYMFLEMSRVLFLLAQLGVFGIYVGKNKIDPTMIADMKLSIFPSYEPEWGGLLGSTRYALTTGKLWLVIYPSLAFFITILGFNLLGEGMKIEVNKRSSRIISWIKKIPYHISPKTYLYELDNYKKYWKSVSIKTTVIILILAMILSPVPPSLLKVEADSVYAHVEEFTKSDYKGRLIGTEGRDEAAEYIVNQLRRLKGVEPLFGQKYYEEEQIKNESIGNLVKSEMYILDDEGNKLVNFKYKEDYSFNIRGVSFDGTIKAKILTLEQFDREEYDENEKYFVVLDNPYDFWGNRRSTNNLILRIVRHKPIIGVFIPYYDYSGIISKKSLLNPVNLENIIDPEMQMYIYTNLMSLVMPVSVDAAYTMTGFAGKEIILRNEMNILENPTVKNIGCMIKSPNPTEETLVIATNYDYLGYEDEEKYKGLLYNGSSVGAALEMVKSLSTINSTLNRDIIFLFLDGSMYTLHPGVEMFMKKNFEIIDDNSIVISFNNLGLKGHDSLFIDVSLMATQDEKYFDYIKYIEKRGKELGTTIKRDKMILGTEDISELCKSGASGLYFQSLNNVEQNQYNASPQNNINMIDKKILKKQTQIILDTIVYMVKEKDK